MKRLLATVCILSGFAAYLPAHERGTTPITWNREISRLVYDKCASCHRPDGSAFSLMTYQEVQPRLVEIKEAVLSRRMPPWGAVKGFGDFRNDQSLTQEQLELITDWIEDDAPKGNNPNVLPKVPKFDKPPVFKSPKGGLVVRNDMPLNRDLVLDGLWPERVPPDDSMQVVATLPDGSVEPLLWLHDYNNAQRHPFLFREPLALPSGTVIRGVSQDARLVLIPAKTTKISK
jgi:mono/diheme cytochrome c family protein